MRLYSRETRGEEAALEAEKPLAKEKTKNGSQGERIERVTRREAEGRRRKKKIRTPPSDVDLLSRTLSPRFSFLGLVVLVIRLQTSLFLPYGIIYLSLSLSFIIMLYLSRTKRERGKKKG